MLLFYNDNIFWNNYDIHLVLFICVNGFWLLQKSKNMKVLLLNTESFFKDMPKEEIQAKFEHANFFEEHKLYLNV